MRSERSKREQKKEKIIALRQQGLSYLDIVQCLKVSKSSVAYHVGEGQKTKARQRAIKNKQGVKSKVFNFICERRESYKPNPITRIKYISKKAKKFLYGGVRGKSYQMAKAELKHKQYKIWNYLNKIWPGISKKNKNVQAINQWTKELDFEKGEPVMYPWVRCKLTNEIVDAELSDVHCDHADGDRTNNGLDNFTMVQKRFNEMKGRDSYAELYENCKKFIKIYEKYNF